MSPALWKHRSSTLPGWTACRTVFRTARPPKHCGRSAISISLSCRRSNHRAASAGTDKPFTDIAHNGLHRRVHRNPPARRCVSLSMGTPRRAGPPYGLPAQATTQGGQFWTPIGGQYSTPVDISGVGRPAQLGKRMWSSGSMRAQIETLILATSGVQLANGFFNTLISLRVVIEDFEATMAGLVPSSYFAGFTLAAVRCERIIERVGHIRAYAAFAPSVSESPKK